MPQNRRSVAFSSKQKKVQLKAKKDKKRQDDQFKLPERSEEPKGPLLAPSELELKDRILAPSEHTPRDQLMALTEQLDLCTNVPQSSLSNNRYQLKFRKETTEEITKRKLLHYTPFTPISDTQLEVNIEQFFPDGLDYPKRPPWCKTMSKVQLNQQENRSFRLFTENLNKKFQHISRYEMNVETWRQLWRVTEKSDLLLIIVDARFAIAQFPPYLYNHLVAENKGIIVVLNKCDLIPPTVVLACMDYLTNKFPKLLVVPFCSLEGRKHIRGILKMAAESSLGLVKACQQLVKDQVNLSSWIKKIEEERDNNSSADDDLSLTTTTIEDVNEDEVTSNCRYSNGVVTIGTIGHPNVGKSSVINALMGKKVVSVSRAPGHTKYFQTIFLTKNVKLCDCPGLVFPSVCPQQLQVMAGSYPIAQFRDPLSVIHYIGSRIDLPSILRLKPLDNQYDAYKSMHDQDDDKKPDPWTASSLAEAWAMKRSYFVRTKGGKPDIFRAANELLRFTLSGHKGILLYLRPQQYQQSHDVLINDPRIQQIQLLQGYQLSKSSIVPTPQQQQSFSGPTPQQQSSSGPTPLQQLSKNEQNDDYFSSDDQSDDQSDEEEEMDDAKLPNRFAILNDE